MRDRGAADAYVRRTKLNEHTSWWRRAWRKRERLTDAVPDDQAAPAHDTTERDELRSLVQTLPRRQRAAVILRFYDDLSEVQTAEALGCSVGTVKSQTSRALAKLRNALTTPATSVNSTPYQPAEEATS